PPTPCRHRRSSSSNSSSRPTKGVSLVSCCASKRLSTETRPQCRPYPHWPYDALEVSRSEVVEFEQIAKEPSRAIGDDHCVRLGDPLQSSRQVRGLANDATLLRLPRSDQVADYHQSRCDTDARLQGRMGLPITYSSDQFQ